MPNQFPKVSPKAKSTSTTKTVVTAIGGLAFAGAIYGVGLWLAFYVLRQASVVSETMSWRSCLYLSYIYVVLRSYDKQLFSSK